MNVNVALVRTSICEDGSNDSESELVKSKDAEPVEKIE